MNIDGWTPSSTKIRCANAGSQNNSNDAVKCIFLHVNTTKKQSTASAVSFGLDLSARSVTYLLH